MHDVDIERILLGKSKYQKKEESKGKLVGQYD